MVCLLLSKLPTVAVDVESRLFTKSKKLPRLSNQQPEKLLQHLVAENASLRSTWRNHATLKPNVLPMPMATSLLSPQETAHCSVDIKN